VADSYECTLVTPEKQLLEEQVVYASVPAWDGLVGVAPQRAPLAIKLGDGPMRLDLPDGDSRWFFVGGGFAQMKDNKLTVLADEAVPADRINTEEARASLKEAEARVAIAEDEVAQRRRQIERAKHLISIAGHAED